MATGYGFGVHCFQTANEAINAYWSSQPVTITPVTGLTNGTFHTQFIYNGTGTSWTKYQFRCTQATTTNSCTVATNPVPVITPPSCTLSPENNPVESFADGHLMGWAVVAAMAVAWGIKVMRRGI